MQQDYIKFLTDWFDRQPLLSKLLKNASKLLSGDLVAQFMGFVAVVLTARALGPETFGVLVLIQAYVSVVDKLVNFQSWQALIKYGADALESNTNIEFKRLIKFGTVLDSGSAVIGTIVAIGGAYAVGFWQGWESETIFMIVLYSSVILFNLDGTPTAILRLFDKFGLFAVQKIFAGAIKLTGVSVAYFLSYELLAFLLVYIITTVVGHVVLLYMGWRELRLNKFYGVLEAELKGITKSFKGLWSYIWTTNFSGSIRMASRKIDTLVVGAILGTASTGLYEIAKKFANMVNKLSNPLYQAIYPDLARLWSKGDKKAFVKLGMQSASFAGGIAILIWGIFLLLGDWVIFLSVGSDYAEAYPVLIWYLLAIVIEISAFPLQPAMLAMGYPKKSFYIHVFTTIAYFATLFPLLFSIGLPGAGVAYFLYYVLWTLSMGFVEYRMLNTG